jgi:hypothetical protein
VEEEEEQEVKEEEEEEGHLVPPESRHESKVHKAAEQQPEDTEDRGPKVGASTSALHTFTAETPKGGVEQRAMSTSATTWKMDSGAGVKD